jgi:hypothetical protein
VIRQTIVCDRCGRDGNSTHGTGSVVTLSLREQSARKWDWHSERADTRGQPIRDYCSSCWHQMHLASTGEASGAGEPAGE